MENPAGDCLQGSQESLVSTVALSDFVTPQNVMNDVVLIEATGDPWGMNRLQRGDLKKAALTVASMVESEEDPDKNSAPLITMTTLGGSFLTYATPIKKALEKQGYEVAVFHAVSSSMRGAIMEKLIREGKGHGGWTSPRRGFWPRLPERLAPRPDGWRLYRNKGFPRSLALEGWGSSPLVH